MEFEQNDLEQIESLGIQPEIVKEQLDRFENGFPDLELCRSVKINDGLQNLSDDERNRYIDIFNTYGVEKSLLKFVPASGAASRMFKILYNYLEGTISSDNADLQTLYKGLKNFAFSDELFAFVNKPELDKFISKRDKRILELLLSEEGLNYGFLPKALLTFHKYKDGELRKAIDEHLVEGAQYCADSSNKVQLHFTVSTEHIHLLKEHLEKGIPAFEKRFEKKFEVSFSVQDKATDTIAVDMENNPIRKDNDDLLFRPGGHGALLKNLNEIDADVIFIKNIDNVSAEWLIKDTIDYKKVLGGVLIQTQSSIFNYCKTLQNTAELSAKLENEIVAFLAERLGYIVPKSFVDLDKNDKVCFLFNKLNRPTRICGVVEASNTGGGPFWVKNEDGTETLQLVETAQINLKDDSQLNILQSSQYANITDLVCGVKDFEGRKFDLMKFRDPDTGFISEKSLGGKSIKAMELPGLWNGAMSDWNTVFVVVPITTFNPVKTVLDLLKKEHQGIKD